MKIFYTNQPLSAFVLSKEEKSSFLSSDVFKDKKALVTDRFWKSIKSALKVDSKLFNYFTSEEIFSRVIHKQGEIPYRFCVEEYEGNLRMLGITEINKDFPSLSNLVRMIKEEPTIESGYHDGEIFSISILNSSKISKTKESSPSWTPLILRRHPVDGVDKGRQTFGVMIGDFYLFFDVKKINHYSTSGELKSDFFTSLLSTRNRKEIPLSIEKAILLRLSSAQKSAASLREVAQFFRLCDRFSVAIERYDEHLSHPFEGYGLSSYNTLSQTRLSKIPIKNSIFELFETMAIAARDFPTDGRWKIYELAGQMIINYFDFEGISYNAIVGLPKTNDNLNIDVNADNGISEEVDLSTLSETTKEVSVIDIRERRKRGAVRK